MRVRSSLLARVTGWVTSAALSLAAAGNALAGPWFPAGPAIGTYSIATHPSLGGMAVLLPEHPEAGTWSTSDEGAHWVYAPGAGGYRVWFAGEPTTLWTDGPRRSTDFGRSWRYVDSPAGQVVQAVNPANPDELVVTSFSFSRIAHSRDGGRTWTLIAVPGNGRSLAVDWSTRDVYVSLSSKLLSKGLDDSGAWYETAIRPAYIQAANGIVLVNDFDGALHRSNNRGFTFTQVAPLLGIQHLCQMAVARPPSTRVYAIDCDRATLIRSDDRGLNWETWATFDDGPAIFSLAVDAIDPDRLYVGTWLQVLASTDGGSSFKPLERGMRAPGTPHQIAFDAIDPLRLWLVEGQSYPRLVQSTDGGTRWFVRREIDVTGLYVVGASRARAKTLYAFERNGAQDAAVKVSSDGGVTWSRKIEPLGQDSTVFDLLVHGSPPGKLFVAARGYNGADPVKALYASVDDGGSFQPKTLPPVDVLRMASTTTGPPLLYAGGYAPVPATGDQLWRSADDGTTWQLVADFPARWMAQGSGGGGITAIAVDPVDSAKLYVAFAGADYVLRSVDAGATWTRATEGLGAGAVWSLAIDARDPSTLYAAQLGSGAFRSVDGARTWTALDAGLDSDDVFNVIVDPHHPDRIYAVTQSGLFRADLADGVPAGRRRAIEFYHEAFDHYFVTADADEIAGLDAGAFEGWRRTHYGFRVAELVEAGAVPTCRFFGVGFAPLSSHFYTPYPAECEGLKLDPAWLYERIAFGLAMPELRGGCPPYTRPLYRAWNRNMGGAPNHRFTTSFNALASVLQQQWLHEGNADTLVYACVPY